MKTPLIVLALVLAWIQPVRAQTWTQTSAISNNWKFVATSADGTRMVALDGLYGIYASTNSGRTWQSATNGPVLANAWWSSLAGSADGNQWVATACYSTAAPGNGGMFVSTNSGLGWTKTNKMMQLNAVACSADGTKTAALGYYILYSTNSGSNWTQSITTDSYWTSLAMSADGTKMAAATTYDGVYVSTNAGSTWTQYSTPNKSWTSLVSSADGGRLAAVDSGRGVYTSTNFAVSWVSNALPAAAWCAVASSADGRWLIAAATNGLIYSSTNWGNAWASNSVPTNHWSAVASSADGCKLAAAVNGGGIFTSYTVPQPRMSLAISNRTLAFSWTVASTNFVLEQITNLTKANWAKLTNTPVLNCTNLQYQVTLPLTNPAGFYRLGN